MNPAAFFAQVHSAFGKLDQSQVDGINTLLTALAALPLTHQAYLLSTCWHETAKTMQPIAEYGRGHGRLYGAPAGQYGHIYYGRGYVQLTWLANYQKAGLATGRDLVQFPDQALDPDIAAQILVKGCEQGWFTGHRLADYSNYTDMRRVINGTDKAGAIAGYARAFEKALNAK